MNFSTALHTGKASEQRVLEMVQNRFPCATIIDGKFKGYDIWIPEINKSVEVKKDFQSQDTGNVLIEIEMYGKNSGLTATRADWWVFHLADNEFIWITPDKLKNKLLSSGFSFSTFTGNGDDHPKKAFLIDKFILKKWANNRNGLI